MSSEGKAGLRTVRPEASVDAVDFWAARQILRSRPLGALEFYSEADLSLPVYLLCSSILIALLDYLAKSTVAGICVRRIKLGPIEEIKVIHLQDTREALAEIEALSYIGVLVV
jgi:hypothetical protein